MGKKPCHLEQMHESHNNLFPSKAMGKKFKGANIMPISYDEHNANKHASSSKNDVHLTDNTVISDAELSSWNLFIKIWLILKWKCE